MLTVIPFLFIVRIKGTSFPLLVYADTYDNAVIKTNTAYPECEITNNTIL